MKITTKYIEDKLKEYKENSSTIETTLARVKAYEKALENPTSYTQISFSTQSDMGSIKGKGGVPSSPVEKEVINKENDEMLIVENLKEWIKEDLSRIYPLQIEKEQIDGALNALTEQQRYIVERKYFENMMWKDIERSLNDEFRQQNFITDSGIKKINSKSLELMTKILELHYSRLMIL